MEDGQPADLVITTSSVPSGTVGTPYSTTLAATGGITPYTWVVDSLPGGLTVNPSTGVISGTPSQSGTFDLLAQVTDAQVPADTAIRSLSLTIAPAPVPDPLVITTTSLPAARRNKNYNRTLTATGGVTPYTWSVVNGSLPPGLTLNASSGVVSGRATTLGTFAFTVQVSDSQSPAATATKALSMTVTR
jgi:Putative Ig domain